MNDSQVSRRVSNSLIRTAVWKSYLLVKVKKPEPDWFRSLEMSSDEVTRRFTNLQRAYMESHSVSNYKNDSYKTVRARVILISKL